MAAVLFGGAVLGLGNALQGLLAADNAHAHHQHHEQAGEVVVLLPAHCMFCIDGMSPQPTALFTSTSAAIQNSQQPRTATSVEVLPATFYFRYQSRAPPAQLSVIS